MRYKQLSMIRNFHTFKFLFVTLDPLRHICYGNSAPFYLTSTSCISHSAGTG